MFVTGFTPKHAGYDLGYAIRMEVVNMDDGRYEQTERLPGSSADSDASSSVFESNDSSEPASDTDKQSDEEDLREDIQKNIPSFYKSDSNASHTSNDITDDEEFQATALCQFMDILNDLDEVLDKSLLACLDEGTKSFDSDEEDLICKIKECIADTEADTEHSVSQSSIDDATQVLMGPIAQASQSTEEIDITHSDSLPRIFGRSKSYTDLPRTNSEISALSLERANTVEDSLRNSMRRLEPIVLPAISTQDSSRASCEPLTLPVILFVEHHVNMRPTSAPIQLQVSAANVSSNGPSGPLIVGRRTLLMNRALSLPSPGDSDVTGADWSERNSRNVARSASGSSSSSESLIGVVSITPNAFNASEDR